MDVQRFVRDWVYDGIVAAVFLIALAPLVLPAMTPAAASVYVLLVVYMLHQYEEHDRDRFRAFVNTHIGGGREVLSPFATMVVNVVGVWGVLVAALYLAAYAEPGFGLIGVYLLLVNTFAHVGGFVVLKRYNPGLVTGIVLFVPAAIAASVVINGETARPVLFHAIGLAVAVAIHAGLIVYVKQRGRALSTAPL